MSDPLVEKATQIVLAMASALLLHDSETVRELYDGINQSQQGPPISDSAVDRMEQSRIIHMDDRSFARHDDPSFEDFHQSGTVHMPSGSAGSARSSPPRSHMEEFGGSAVSSPMIDRTSQRKPPNQLPFEIYVDPDPDESYRSFKAQLGAPAPPQETPTFRTHPDVASGRHYLTVPEPHHMRNPNLSGGRSSPRSLRAAHTAPQRADDLDESISTLVQRIHRQAEVMLARERSISGGGRGSNTPRRG